MIGSFKSKCGAAAVVAIVCLGAPAQAQKPSEEQLSAIRSSCRSDFLSNCSGVPRGGKEALDCLRQHMAQLSPACGSAVKAVTPPPAAMAPPPPAAKTTPPPPPSPPPAAAAPPPPPAPAAPPPPAAAAPPPAAAAPKQTAAPPSAKPVAPKTKPKKVEAPPPPQAVAPPPIPLEKIEALPLPKRLAIVRRCRADLDAVCPSVKRGGGRVIACLAAHRPALSPPCRQALEKELKD